MTRRTARKTRIVATLGPATSSAQRIKRLIQAGVDIVRLNFSHGSREFHQDLYDKVRRISAELGEPVAILQDLSGPKMRVGRLEQDRVRLRTGETLTVIEGHGVGTAEQLFVEASGAIGHLEKGHLIRLADGLLELKVSGVTDEGVECRVQHGGVLRSRQGINIPGADLGVKPLTPKDRKDLAFGVDLGVDAVALSFVRDHKDILALRRVLAKLGRSPFVVAKIERAEALKDLDNILEVTSGVMVARGDLGVEIGVEKVPMAQKRIIAAAVQAHRPVITATQMLESMIERPTPTRAEVSDVANAVLEGTDALMLSGETAIGAHSVAAVKTLVDVSREAEHEVTTHRQLWADMRSLDEGEAGSDDVAQAVSRAARTAAIAVDAVAVLGFTASGRTLRLISSQRPRRKIFGFTHRKETWRRMKFYWGVIPQLMQPAETVADMIADAEDLLVRRREVRKGDRVVVVCGQKMGSGSTNSLHVHTVGEA